ncbi:bile acid:sodium symporter family protein [Nocardia cyriacigeorgica]|uniref:Bile acid:sodium symporter n=1 Tax=Nocardia cyriacigeorgica TaxID=135487 RepID=A0A6P1DBG5_9NOCA|nr:bile acid:sodium symporter family protein [Nocardia cyriacigeorgica]NEW46180.1 bile acid:sodium symporter [Nocardia cyriacigeorgica]
MRFLSRFSIDGFVLAIFAMVGVATIVPASGTGVVILDWATKAAIAALFFIYGARLSPAQAWQGVTHWRLHTVILATTFVVFPLLGLALWVLVPGVLSEELYAGVLFLCLVPSTVQSSIAFTSMARGNVGAAIVSASFSNLLGVFLTPLLVVALMHTTGEAHIDAGAAVAIVGQLLVPFLLGQLARPWIGGWLTRHAQPVKLVDRGSILLVVYAAFSAGMRADIWSKVGGGDLLVLVAVSAVLFAVVAGMTTWAGKLFGFPREDRIVILFAGSKKSLASGLPMAAVLFGGTDVGLMVLPLMLFHQLQLIACAVIAQRLGRQAEALEEAQADATPATVVHNHH